MKDPEKLGIFLDGLSIFGRAILEWLRFFRVKSGRVRKRESDFDWEKELLS